MVLLESWFNCFRVCTWETLYTIWVWKLELPKIVQLSGQWEGSSLEISSQNSPVSLFGQILSCLSSPKAKEH